MFDSPISSHGICISYLYMSAFINYDGIEAFIDIRDRWKVTVAVRSVDSFVIVWYAASLVRRGCEQRVQR